MSEVSDRLRTVQLWGKPASWARSHVPDDWDGSALRRARHLLGLTQPQAAFVIGCHVNSVVNWENEYRQPSERCMPAVLEFIAAGERVMAK